MARHDLYRRGIYDELLRQIKNDPEASEKQIRDALWEQTKKRADWQELLFDNWFISNWPRVQIEERAGSTQVRFRQTERKVTRPAQVRAEAERVSGVILMNTTLPGASVKLRDATGAQCRKAGGFFNLVARYVKPTQVVGKKLTEAELGNLYARAK